MGAPSDTILGALLHDAKRDQTPDQQKALLLEIRQSLGENVAEILTQAWEGHLLPRDNWEEWLDALTSQAPAPDLIPLVAADTLCTFRSILLDWEALHKHLNPDADPENKREPLWMWDPQDKVRIERSRELSRQPWLPAPAAPKNVSRQALFDAFSKHGLCFGSLSGPSFKPAPGIHPTPHPKHPVFSIPALSLKLSSNVWDRVVLDTGIANRIAAWDPPYLGLKPLIIELRRILWQLKPLPDACYIEWLRQQPLAPSQPNAPVPGWVNYCRDQIRDMELNQLLSGEHSPLVQFFQSHIQYPVRGRFKKSRLNERVMGESMLLYRIGEYLQIQSLFAPKKASLPEEEEEEEENHEICIQSASIPPKNPLLKKTIFQMVKHPEVWPLTAIPAYFHPLEIISLMLSLGWKEDEAILAVFNSNDHISPLLEHWLADRSINPFPDNQLPDAALRPEAHAAAQMMEAISLCRFLAQDIAFVEQPAPALTLRMEAFAPLEQLRQIMCDDPKKASQRITFNSRFGQDQKAFQKALLQAFPGFRPPKHTGYEREIRIMELDAFLPALTYPFCITDLKLLRFSARSSGSNLCKFCQGYGLDVKEG